MKRTMDIRHPYLWFPIQLTEAEEYLEIEACGEKLFEFKIPFAEDDNDYQIAYYASIPVKEWMGKKLTFSGAFSEEFLGKIRNEDKAYQNICKRPAMHFTAEYGWINDPNGLVYDGENYHMYFQYNPFNLIWRNMLWGHATSKDLLHWNWCDPALYPDANGMMFSGCGIRNEKGLLNLSENALLFFYTAAGDSTPWSKGADFTQRIAYSVDGGYTLEKLDKPYVGKIGKDSRDPKVFWHEPSQAYIMMLYLEGNDFAILRSQDLEAWEETQRFTLEKAWECPDLVELQNEAGEKRWMFICADGFYYWGEFDGYRFDSDWVRHEAYINEGVYAAQSFSGVEERTILVPWLRITGNGFNYTGAMGIPRELSWRKEQGEAVLVMNPIREFTTRLSETEVIPENGVYVVEIRDFNDNFTCHLNGSELRYDKSEAAFYLDEHRFLKKENCDKIKCIVDYNILEVCQADDIMLGGYKLRGDKNVFTHQTSGKSQVKIYKMEE